MKQLSEMSLKELWTLFPIQLCDHRPIWKDWFLSEKELLTSLLPHPALIHHIGSTAIPGICAKPIVDILVELWDESTLRDSVDVLKKAGYLLMNATSTRASLNKGYTPDGFAERVFHIHLRLPGDHDELYFRDYLRITPDAAASYDALKRSLLERYEHDRDGYTAAKTEFVRLYTALGKSSLLQTQRLFLRPWQPDDAEILYQLASDPDVGYPAGWPAHQSVEHSRAIINTVFSAPECFAICLDTPQNPIGAISLKLGSSTDMTGRPDECELGYWLGKPYWGQGITPEAGQAILDHAFDRLGMRAIWCGHYEGNTKSRRVMEKLGFSYVGKSEGLEVPLLGEVRTGHLLHLTREDRHA